MVYWEIFNRLQSIDGKVNCYSKPYHEYLPDEPSFDDLYQTVCVQKLRPSISPQLITVENPVKLNFIIIFFSFKSLMNIFFQILFQTINLIRECLTENRLARLTSLRIKKTIIDLQRDIQH